MPGPRNIGTNVRDELEIRTEVVGHIRGDFGPECWVRLFDLLHIFGQGYLVRTARPNFSPTFVLIFRGLGAVRGVSKLQLSYALLLISPVVLPSLTRFNISTG